MKEPLIVQLETPAAIIEADSRRSDEVRRRVGEIDTTLTLSSFELGDLLAETKANNYWRDWGYESFSEAVKASKIDISPRQAEYLIQISKVSKLLKISKSSLAKAKNSKLKEVFTLDPGAVVKDEATQTEESMADIMVQLVEDCPNKTLVEIKAIVKRLKGETEEPAGQLTWLNWPVRRDAKQVIEETLDKAGQIAGQTFDMLTKEAKDLSKASALELVCADWAADPNNEVEEGEVGNFQDAVETGDENCEDNSLEEE